MPQQRADLLTSLLKDVSRSFYLTLGVLPPKVRRQIGLAYLLARTSDTVADTELLEPGIRLHALHQYAAAIQASAAGPPDFERFLTRQEVSAERVLLERAAEALTCLETFNTRDQEMIREVLHVIISGQILDLERFATRRDGEVRALKTAAELDDYTYRVAGCVGSFWTKICFSHLWPEGDSSALLTKGVAFGKGLQLVNILRDLPKDLSQGRCYLPSEELAATGLEPKDLLSPASESRLRKLYERYLDLAERYLAEGWEYTVGLPGNSARVKLACAWPVLIGTRTLQKLRIGPILDPAQRTKVTRVELRGIIFRSIAYYPFPRLWQRQFERETRGEA
jgi:farnesyl-diphosphate farnesyltransferase